ncbi:MAG: hypothetical protein B7Z37_07555 [Verrucomicrobia bacterium 12-59-8]|nr:MAG: hypothetical protein B7Z37_07555 [Verrucomicrobia bacterium 12-59-8]
MQRPLIAFLALYVALTGRSAKDLKFPTTPPTEPQNAAKTFRVLDGFEMQLIAAEPLVTDPVAITYDEDGRAYVCEMNDYPYTDKEHHQHAQENPTDQSIGKVRLLTDTDGDGHFDKATIFADGLSWPTGAACWKGGIFVTATPDVWYLKDTNGDGVADIRQKIFTGFKKLNVQAVMNNPIWGLDHRIYIAGGSNGGEIQRAPGSDSVMALPADFKPLPIKRNDFSFDPSTGDVRLESGGARFGNTFDDWGNRFLCNIRNPCQHVVLPYRYLARNPYLVVPSALNDCAEAGDQLPVYRTSPPEPWREFRAKRWVQEGSTLPKSELVGAGVVTSSAGITVYRGDAYPPEYRDFVFVADVAGNLFYRMKLVPDGVTFKAVQVDGTKNFCTSDDLWSRPVNFVNAPDGCLHVCDIYREVIEHPWSIPDDIHTAVDLLRGRDKGRIYRLAPRDAQQSGPLSPLSSAPQSPFKPRPTPKLSTFTTADLVTLLDHPNAWHRETAQRLLFERQDKAAVELLQAMAKSGNSAQGRMGALWALQGGDALGLDHVSTLGGSIDNPSTSQHQAPGDGAPLIVAIREDKDFHVREMALVIAQGIIRQSRNGNAQKAGSSGVGIDPSLEAWYAILESIKDTAIRVRVAAVEASGDYKFQLGGYALQHTLGTVLRTDGSNSWARARILATDNHKIADVELSHLIGRRLDHTSQISDELLADLCQLVVGRKDNHALKLALNNLIRPQPDWEFITSIFAQLNTRMSKAGWSWHDIKLEDKQTTFLDQCAARFKTACEEKNGSLPVRARSLQALTGVASLDVLQVIASSWLKPDQPAELQFAALEALGAYPAPVVAEILIEAWPKLTPILSEKAITLMLSRTDRIAKLLDAIEAKKILPSQLSAATKATLGRQKAPALAERITKLIGDGGSSNRKEVITKYEPVLSMTGDTTRGAKIYETLCMVCHRHLDRGNDVGPNLGTIKSWTAEQILTNVLDPNREVSPNFALYIVETNDGRTLSGLITSETAGNLTLKRADGGTDTVLRSEIKSLTSPGISLMPEGLEAAITPQQMADLIAYLKAS